LADEVWGDGKGGGPTRAITTCGKSPSAGRRCCGIPFELIDPAGNGGKAVLTLGAKKFPAGHWRRRPVRRLGAQPVLPHAAAWSGGHMANYIVRYDDGTTAETRSATRTRS